eukprot:143681_1
MSTQKIPRNRRCDVCAKTFSTPDSLRRHMQLHYEKHYLCEFCQKGYVTAFNLRQHVRHAHPDVEWRFACPHSTVCSERFLRADLRDNHARSCKRANVSQRRQARGSKPMVKRNRTSVGRRKSNLKLEENVVSNYDQKYDMIFPPDEMHSNRHSDYYDESTDTEPPSPKRLRVGPPREDNLANRTENLSPSTNLPPPDSVSPPPSLLHSLLALPPPPPVDPPLPPNERIFEWISTAERCLGRIREELGRRNSNSNPSIVSLPSILSQPPTNSSTNNFAPSPPPNESTNICAPPPQNSPTNNGVPPAGIPPSNSHINSPQSVCSSTLNVCPPKESQNCMKTPKKVEDLVNGTVGTQSHNPTSNGSLSVSSKNPEPPNSSSSQSQIPEIHKDQAVSDSQSIQVNGSGSNLGADRKSVTIPIEELNNLKSELSLYKSRAAEFELIANRLRSGESEDQMVYVGQA